MTETTARPQPVSGPFIGRPLPRFEDERLVRGKGRYTDDFSLPSQCHAVFIRSPLPSARIRSIDASEAAAAPGVLAILTGQDYLDAGGKPLVHFADPADARDHKKRAFRHDAGNVSIDIPHLPMPVDRTRYIGEPVAMVVAETLDAAHDAAELVDIDYDELPFVTDADTAMEDGAPLVDDAIAGNLAVKAHFGDADRTQTALASADIVVEQRFVNQRIINAQMEPRSAIVSFDPATDVYRMIAGSQGAIRQRDTLAAALGVDAAQVEVICPDVGGGFGPRTNMSPEQPMLAIAAKRLQRPVRWTSTRSEAFLTDYQCRDIITTGRLGLTSDGRIVGYGCEIVGNVGAYTVSFVPMANSFRVMTTAYDVPAASVSIRGAMTHTAPTAPYRGAGRPEATYAMERLLDIAAGRLGIDRVAIRQRNLIRRDQLPHTTAMGLTYDSGDFSGNLEKALRLADHDGFAARRKSAADRGMLAGIGFAAYVESPVGIPHERIDITIDPEGVVKVVTGTQSTGQGHETSFAQVIADRLGVTPEDVRLISGDTTIVRSGGGSHSDRSMRIGGALLVEASGGIIDAARQVLADTRALSMDDIAFDDGLFRITGANETYTLFDVARLKTETPDQAGDFLTATASFTGRMPAYPTGAAVCEVEIDPETGCVTVTRYSSVDDVGQPINPLILDGQVHGGIVQGLGQALCETVSHSPDTGQVASGSLMDYAMPRADQVPSFDVELTEDPTSGNPLRVKGGGESGITPALATTINAIVDALRPYGIEHIDMPATSAKIWAAIQSASQAEAARPSTRVEVPR